MCVYICIYIYIYTRIFWPRSARPRFFPDSGCSREQLAAPSWHASRKEMGCAWPKHAVALRLAGRIETGWAPRETVTKPRPKKQVPKVSVGQSQRNGTLTASGPEQQRVKGFQETPVVRCSGPICLQGVVSSSECGVSQVMLSFHWWATVWGHMLSALYRLAKVVAQPLSGTVLCNQFWSGDPLFELAAHSLGACCLRRSPSRGTHAGGLAQLILRLGIHSFN